MIERQVASLKGDALTELARIEAMGGALAVVDTGYMKQRLVESGTARLAAVATATQPVVGVNCFCDSEPAALAAEGGFLAIDPAAEAAQVARLEAQRAARDPAVETALDGLRAAAGEGRNIMEPSIACARAGVTTGEWGQTLRGIFGKYRAPTGLDGVGAVWTTDETAGVRARVDALTEKLGRRPKMLVGKPGLDGHSDGAEQIAVCARDCGFEVVYEGIRLTPARMRHLAGIGRADLPVVVGGMIPAEDAAALCARGVARVFTSKDYALATVMAELVDLVEQRAMATVAAPL